MQTLGDSLPPLASMEVLTCPPSPRNDHKRKVIVHVTFIKVGEINTLKECFEADVLLRSKWREPELDSQMDAEDFDLTPFWNPKLFIENTIGDPKVKSSVTLEHNVKDEAFIVERRRVKGTFMEKLELWDFPFDVQDLSVSLMSDLPSTEVDLVEDSEEIHKIYKQSFIDEQEWYLYKYIESDKQDLPRDKADPSVTQPALIVRCRAGRRPAYFIWNIFSVTFLICCLAFVTFAVTPRKPENRLQLSFTLVLTAVAFKFVVNQSLPKVSYLTYLDRYVLMAMILLAGVCFWHGTQTLWDSDQHPRVDPGALILFGTMFILFNLWFWIKISVKPFRKRREMKNKELVYVQIVRQQAEQKRSRLTTLKNHLRLRTASLTVTWNARTGNIRNKNGGKSHSPSNARSEFDV